MLYLDWESRSECDLKVKGTYHYLAHPTTEGICLGWAFEEGPVGLWWVQEAPIPGVLLDYLQGEGPVTAHYATFDRGITSLTKQLPRIKLTRWQCSAVRARAAGLPGKLVFLARVLKLDTQKQPEGKRLIRLYCEPGHLKEFLPGDRELMESYCKDDVAAMREACRLLPQLSSKTWREYHVTERINARGIPVNTPFAEAAVKYAEDIREDVNRQIHSLTKGRVIKATARKTRDAWVLPLLTKKQQKILTVVKKGVKKISFDEDHRNELLEDESLNMEVRRFIELVNDAGGATLSKYKAIVNQSMNGRMYGALTFMGAPATGRYSSHGFQMQNMRRDVIEGADTLIARIRAGGAIKNPADTLGRLIRASVNSSKGLTWGDYSQIEAVIIAWLTKNPAAQPLLDKFSAGEDLYLINAEAMLGTRDISEEERFKIKGATLGGGFGGGAMALKRQLPHMSLEELDVLKDQWREANYWVPEFWWAINDALSEAYENEGRTVEVGRISLTHTEGRFFMLLPSGRYIMYTDPGMELHKAPWEDEPSWKLTAIAPSVKPKKQEKVKWPRRPLNHILLSNNCTQGTAGDILREGVVETERQRLSPILTVHDEIVCEGLHTEALKTAMISSRSWRADLPLRVKINSGRYYGK